MATAAATFVFADIAGFTALTEAHGDEEALKLIEEFSEAVATELPAVRGEHVERLPLLLAGMRRGVRPAP
jgi:class 3 adenylate cyclase